MSEIEKTKNKEFLRYNQQGSENALIFFEKTKLLRYLDR